MRSFNSTSGRIRAVFGADSREVITINRLEQDIIQEIFSKGRTNTLALSSSLNIGVPQIEATIAERVSKYQDIFIIQNEQISMGYLREIGQEVNELLQNKGVISMTQISQRYALPIDLIQAHMPNYVGSTIAGHLHGKHIYTQPYKNRMRSMLQGMLLGLTIPTQIKSIINSTAIAIETNFLRLCLMEIVDELGATIESNKVGQEVFIPKSFMKLRDDWIGDMFKKNGHITYNTLLEIGINQPKNYMKKYFEGISLKSLYLSNLSIQNIKHAITQALESQPVVYVPDYCGEILSEEDMPKILNLFMGSLPTKYIILDDLYFVPVDTVDRCLLLFERHFLKDRPAQLFDDVAVELIKQWFPRIDGVKSAKLLYNHIQTKINELYEIRESPSSHLVLAQEDPQCTFRKSYETLYYNICYFYTSASKLQDSILKENLNHHLMNSLCKDLTNLIVKELSSQYYIKEENAIESLPKVYSEALMTIQNIQSSSKINVASYLQAVLKLASQLQVPLKDLNEDMESKIIQTHMQNLQRLLSTETDPTKLFQFALVSLYSRINNSFLLVSSKHIKELVQYLHKEQNIDLTSHYKILLHYIKDKKSNDAQLIETRLRDVRKSIDMILES